MNDDQLMEASLAAIIRLVSNGEYSEESAKEQARLYLSGIRDVRIGDVTFQAITLARMIARQ